MNTHEIDIQALPASDSETPYLVTLISGGKLSMGRCETLRECKSAIYGASAFQSHVEYRICDDDATLEETDGFADAHTEYVNSLTPEAEEEAETELTIDDLDEGEKLVLYFVRKHQISQVSNFILKSMMMDGIVSPDIDEQTHIRGMALISLCLVEMGMGRLDKKGE